MRNLSEFFSPILLSRCFAGVAADVPNAMLMSDDFEVQRRRKGDGPEGRAEAPVRRDSGGGGNRLPPWLTILIVIIILVCGGGKTALDSIFGGSGDDNTPTEESAPAEA